MFKNLELFDGFAGDVNKAIDSVNKECKRLGIPQTYDVVLERGFRETEDSINGNLDLAVLVRNGIVVESGLTCSEVIEWCYGFLDCAKMISLYKQ